LEAAVRGLRSEAFRILRLTVGFAIFTFMIGAPARSQESAPAGDAENGKKLFNAIGCWQCHGYSGQGGSGPKIAPDPIPYPAFNRYVRKPSGSMPPYSPKVLSDAALADIYSFLVTIPKPPDPDSIPLLNND
jgi:ubiquinol-cytochrome c reductase cytochrome c subunit